MTCLRIVSHTQNANDSQYCANSITRIAQNLVLGCIFKLIGAVSILNVKYHVCKSYAPSTNITEMAGIMHHILYTNKNTDCYAL